MFISGLSLETTVGFAREEAFLPRRPAPPDVPVGTLEEIADETVVKLLARHDTIDPEPFWAQVADVVGDLVTTTWSSSTALVEMSAQGVTKASTLELLCREMGVAAAEVVAFGDMPNDIPLLEWAGTSFAMDNAHPSVHATATRRAPANDVDGVATVLADLFGL